MLTSTRNPRVLAARKLLRRTGRRAAGAFLIEGPGLLSEAVASGIEVTEVFVTEGRDAPAASAAASAGAEVHVVGDHVGAALASTATPQGVVAVGRIPQASLAGLPADTDLVLVLDEVSDPGNAGTLVRSALAAGAGAVVFTTGSVDPYAPKTLRAAAGAAFALKPIFGVTLQDAAAALRSRGFSVVGGDARAGRTIDELDLSGPVALVVGNEAHGLPPGHARALDALVRIDMPGPAESLNVAVAGSLLLFEVVRRRRVSSSFP